MRKVHGSVLFEVLIVVANIGILAAVVGPNFLDAQTRAKVAQTRANMATVAIAMESYLVDNDMFPMDSWHSDSFPMWNNIDSPRCPNSLTTPIKYLPGDLMRDPFKEE